MQTCAACYFRRCRYLIGGKDYSCKKSGKLCSLTDLRLAELYCQENGPAPLPMERHRDLTIAVQEGQQRALHLVNNHEIGISRSSEEFQKTIADLHSQIFKGTGLRFAGNFRRAGEPDVLFGSGRNEKRGAEAEEIPARLDSLYSAVIERFVNTEVTAARLARVCGQFLEEFFMIHPFHDGNGRVARLYLRIMASSTGLFYFDVLPEDAKSRRKYTQALAFAHRHCHTHSNLCSSSSVVQDPYKHIASWLLNYIREHDPTDFESLEDLVPEWLEDLDLTDPLGWDEPNTLDDSAYDGDEPY